MYYIPPQKFFSWVSKTFKSLLTLCESKILEKNENFSYGFWFLVFFSEKVESETNPSSQNVEICENSKPNPEKEDENLPENMEIDQPPMEISSSLQEKSESPQSEKKSEQENDDSERMELPK